MSIWKNKLGNPIMSALKAIIDCCHCPCCYPGENTYKIQTAYRDESCYDAGSGGSGTWPANAYKNNISCVCKCLFPGEACGEEDIESFLGEYPIYYVQGDPPNDVHWRLAIIGGPYSAETCAADVSDGCGCSWYKARKAYYDANCPDIAAGYNDTPECECLCLKPGYPAGWLTDPEVELTDDYVEYYLQNNGIVEGQYQWTLFGPFAATCDNTAVEVCAAYEYIEGCYRSWNCSAFYGWLKAAAWFRIKTEYFAPGSNCTGDLLEPPVYWDACFDSTDGKFGYPEVLPFCYGGQTRITIVGGPEWRQCDLTGE
jgi:hypothetical protein